MSLPTSILLAEEVTHDVHEPTISQRLAGFIKFALPSYPIHHSFEIGTKNIFRSILTEVAGSSITREEIFRGVN